MRISDWSSDVCSSDLQVEAAFGQEPAVERVVAISGFSFSGTGQNAGLAFITLKDWSERGAEDAAGAIAGRVNGRLMQIKDGLTFALSPPPIQGLGTTSGFPFRLPDRGGLGQDALGEIGGASGWGREGQCGGS